MVIVFELLQVTKSTTAKTAIVVGSILVFIKLRYLIITTLPSFSPRNFPLALKYSIIVVRKGCV